MYEKKVLNYRESKKTKINSSFETFIATLKYNKAHLSSI